MFRSDMLHPIQLLPEPTLLHAVRLQNNAFLQLLVWRQVAEMRAERERLLNDKASLHSQIAELREHYASLGLAPTTGSSHLGSLRASQEAESARSEALSRLQSAQQSHERAAREWELEKQQLQVSQQWYKRNFRPTVLFQGLYCSALLLVSCSSGDCALPLLSW